ncbi:MAG: serine hydrolase [Pseudomonadota bacterium]
MTRTGFARGAWLTWLLALATALAVCAAPPSPPASAPDAVPAALTRLFNAAEVREGFFTPAIRGTGFADSVAGIRDDTLEAHGALRGVREDEAFWLLDFDEAVVPVFARLDAEGGFTTLWFNLTEPRTPPTRADIEQVLPEFGGTVSLLVERDGELLFARDADTPLAVGSAFKLLVLRALQQQQATGRLPADASLSLAQQHVSLPSGRLQDAPVGSAHRIATLAEDMIRLSDNTATDVLIDALGRDALEALSPRNTPFLDTGAVFRLKDPRNADLLAQWRVGDTAARRGVLDALASRPLPPLSVFDAGPVALDVEWFLSARELCAALRAVGFAPAVVQNPGHLDPSRWARVAYKGGSEPGVINQSFLLEDTAGRTACVVGTWNNEAGMVTLPFLRLMSHLVRLARELP